jgi:hypothetical protein
MKKNLLKTCLAAIAMLSTMPLCMADAGGDFTAYPTFTHEGNRNWIITKGAPGATIEESVTLENLTDKSQKIDLLVREAAEKDGNFIASGSDKFAGVGKWILPEGDSYTLEPFQKIRVPVLIEIPSDASRGKYAAAILASKKEPAGDSLFVTTRIGVRVYLTVETAAEGLTDIFAAPQNKSIFFFGLSTAGLGASILYYMMNAEKHA